MILQHPYILDFLTARHMKAISRVVLVECSSIANNATHAGLVKNENKIDKAARVHVETSQIMMIERVSDLPVQSNIFKAWLR